MSSAVHKSDAIEFEIFGRRVAGKRWGTVGGHPTFALHGWLDNANSFDRLAPFLAELDIVALDFAGHGESDHRPPGVHYHSLTDIQDVIAVADQLGWKTFGLIGHSMGAAISSELAATFPERVISAVLIDGLLATGGVTQTELLEQNRSAVEKMLAAKRAPKKYANVEDMARRVSQATDQTFEAAIVLVSRGSKLVDGGVTWRTDPRIRFPTPLRYTRKHIDLLLAQTTAPGLLIVAEQGDNWYQGEIDDARQAHPNLTVYRMQGPHHVHLEPAYVAGVAAEIRKFLQLDDVPPSDPMEWDGQIS